jgi:hypothetical protein
MFKWSFLLLAFFLVFSVNGQTIPKDFKPQENNQHSINKDISKRDGKAFNNLSHPLSITGGVLTFVGAGLYVLGSETKEREPIGGHSVNNYSLEAPLQYIGIGAFAAGAVLFAIFSTDRGVKAPKRKEKQKYNASEWEVETD